jgi:hypothetical protein
MICLYCGNNHDSKQCGLRYQLPFDIFGVIHISIRKRKSHSLCSLCQEELVVGELEATQNIQREGAFFKTNRAHLRCLLQELTAYQVKYLQALSDKRQSYRETNRRRARERYERVTDGDT